MKIELEASEIKAIAAAVAEMLAPRLDALEAAFTKAIATRQAKAQLSIEGSPTAAITANGEMIDLREVKRMTGLSESSIWRHEKKGGTFPRRRQLSTRRVAWLRAEVIAWLEGRQAA